MQNPLGQNFRSPESQPPITGDETARPIEVPAPIEAKPEAENISAEKKLEQEPLAVAEAPTAAPVPKPESTPPTDLPDFKGVDNAKSKQFIDKDVLMRFDAQVKATAGNPREQLSSYQHMRYEYLKNRFDFPVPDIESEKAA